MLLALEVTPCLDRYGNEARRTVFSFEADPGRRFSASFGNDFDEEDIPRGSLIHITYVEKPGVSKRTGKPIVWRNLVAPPIVLRRGVYEEDEDPFDEFPGLDAGVGFGQPRAGGRTDSLTIAGRLLTNVARARKKLRSLSRRGPLPREVADSIAEAVSLLWRDVRSQLARSF